MRHDVEDCAVSGAESLVAGLTPIAGGASQQAPLAHAERLVLTGAKDIARRVKFLDWKRH